MSVQGPEVNAFGRNEAVGRPFGYPDRRNGAGDFQAECLIIVAKGQYWAKEFNDPEQDHFFVKGPE